MNPSLNYQNVGRSHSSDGRQDIPSGSSFSPSTTRMESLHHRFSQQHGQFPSVDHGQNKVPSMSSYNNNSPQFADSQQEFPRSRKRTRSKKKSKKALQMSPNSRPFHCDICNFATFTAIGLDQHRSHHGIKAPYNCPICNCEAFSIAGLNHHKAKKHPPSSSPNIGPSVSSSAEHSKTKTEVAQLPTKMLKPINVKAEKPFDLSPRDPDRRQLQEERNRGGNEKEFKHGNEEKVSLDRVTLARRLFKEIEEKFRQLDAIRQESSGRVNVLRKKVEKMEEEERVSLSYIDRLTSKREVISQKIADATCASLQADIQLKTIQCTLLDLQLKENDLRVPKRVVHDHIQQKLEAEKKMDVALKEIERLRLEEKIYFQQVEREKERLVKDSQLLATARTELVKEMEELKKLSEPQRRLLLERNKVEEQMIRSH